MTVSLSPRPPAEANASSSAGRDLEDPQPVALQSLPTQRQSMWSSVLWNLLPEFLRVWLTQMGESMRSTPVRYPPRFKALGAIVLGLSLTWVGNYLLAVLPTINTHQNSPCKYNDNQLSHNAKMLFVYFVWFAVARLLLFVPFVAARVAVVQSRTHGFCRTYMVHLVLRDGPLYIFVVGSLLFWFHLMQSPNCEEMSPELYRTLKLYAIYSCLLSIFCLVLAYWHNKLLVDAMREIYERGEIMGEGMIPPSRGAPEGTIANMQTRKYDTETFGDEEGKLYPAECSICLIGWEPDEVIKITPCDHAFHEECLGNWLKTARTCAICRQDVTREGGARRLTGCLQQPAATSVGAASSDHPAPAPTNMVAEDVASPAASSAVESQPVRAVAVFDHPASPRHETV